MEQTFGGVCSAHRHQPAHARLGVVLWLFVDTAIGIGREHIAVIKAQTQIRKLLTDLGTAAAISVMLVLLFLLLEWLTSSPNAGSRLSMFGMLYMWLVPTLTIFLALPIARAMRVGSTILAHPVLLALRVGVAAILAWTWGELMLDQLHCFWGATGC